jgi:hypothetical protein
MNRRHPKPWVVDLSWAGIFLALFIFYKYYAFPTIPEPTWAQFPEIPVVSYSDSFATKPRYEKWSSAPRTNIQKQRLKVAADTVSDTWLVLRGWPIWKAEGFVRDRMRWGGVDSALCKRWDNRMEFDWILNPPQPISLNEVGEDILYAHPLWRSVQVRAIHRFRSRVRPIRNWDEVFQMASFDSAQKALLPHYFYIDK